MVGKKTTEGRQLGSAILMIRELRQMRQKDVAKRAGITAAHLSFIEGGHRSASVEVLEMIGKALGVPVEFILLLSGDTRTCGSESLGEMVEATRAAILTAIRQGIDLNEARE